MYYLQIIDLLLVIKKIKKKIRKKFFKIFRKKVQSLNFFKGNL